jgi:tRNA 2-thiouridine synthesizing protein A
MSEELKASTILDLKGLLCPIPVVRISQGVKQVAVGDVVEAFATDPGVLADIPAWCRTSGNELMKMERLDKGFRFLVRRVR